MDGTASLIYLLAAKENESLPAPSIPKLRDSRKGKTSGNSSNKKFSYSHGRISRGDSTRKEIALVFTGHEFYDGGDLIAKTLKQQNIKASFFFTGDFYYNPKTDQLINRLRRDGHFLGNHSGQHLLYCDWNNRDSLLVTQSAFDEDLFG